MASDEVLVVEDEEYTALLFRFLIEGMGFAMTHLPDGRQVVDRVGSSMPPELVVLDVMLPYVNGISVLEHIRHEDAWASVPVLVVSARSDERDIVDAFDAGANDYVVKPFGPDELVARIWRLLRDQRLGSHIRRPGGRRDAGGSTARSHTP